MKQIKILCYRAAFLKKETSTIYKANHKSYKKKRYSRNGGNKLSTY